DLGEAAQVGVGRTARGPGADERDRPRREFLCQGGQSQEQQRERTCSKVHAALLRVDEPASCPKLAQDARARQPGGGVNSAPAGLNSRSPMPVGVCGPDLSLAVIGTGVMGRGIARVAAQAGIRVLLYDSRPGGARGAKDAVATQWQRMQEK